MRMFGALQASCHRTGRPPFNGRKTELPCNVIIPFEEAGSHPFPLTVWPICRLFVHFFWTSFQKTITFLTIFNIDHSSLGVTALFPKKFFSRPQPQGCIHSAEVCFSLSWDEIWKFDTACVTVSILASVSHICEAGPNSEVERGRWTWLCQKETNKCSRSCTSSSRNLKTPHPTTFDISAKVQRILHVKEHTHTTVDKLRDFLSKRCSALKSGQKRHFSFAL